MNKVIFVFPLIIFSVTGIYLGLGLSQDPKKLPVMLNGKSTPNFFLTPLKGRDTKGLSNQDLVGQVSLVNFWGSWCVSCKIEHPFLLQLKQSNVVPIHGINWREENPYAGYKWLQRLGDPYSLIGVDPDSKTAIAFGVTGAPETFVIDSNGFIRFKHVGPLNYEVWREKMLPLILYLQKEENL